MVAGLIAADLARMERTAAQFGQELTRLRKLLDGRSLGVNLRLRRMPRVRVLTSRIPPSSAVRTRLMAGGDGSSVPGVSRLPGPTTCSMRSWRSDGA